MEIIDIATRIRPIQFNNNSTELHAKYDDSSLLLCSLSFPTKLCRKHVCNLEFYMCHEKKEAEEDSQQTVERSWESRSRINGKKMESGNQDNVSKFTSAETISLLGFPFSFTRPHSYRVASTPVRRFLPSLVAAKITKTTVVFVVAFGDLKIFSALIGPASRNTLAPSPMDVSVGPEPFRKAAGPNSAELPSKDQLKVEVAASILNPRICYSSLRAEGIIFYESPKRVTTAAAAGRENVSVVRTSLSTTVTEEIF